ncbi:MAG: PAS domain S-box protein [Proteobacteria bacterium]|nr:PAS domain S-box protein [Pseudomonadota bacterium]
MDHDKRENKSDAAAVSRESEARYRFITETSIDGIVTTDSQDTVLTWNAGAEGIFGYGPEMIGQKVTRIIPEKYRAAHTAGVRRFIETGEKHLIGRQLELQALRRDGTEFPIELTLSDWRIDGQFFFGAIIRDVSERKRVERLRDQVQRMIRHDLRSPLIGLTGLAGVLLKGSNLTETQIKAANMIQELGQRMLSFIDRSRDLFAIEEGRYSLHPRPVDLHAIFRRLREQLAPLLRKQHVSLSFFSGRRPADLEAGYGIAGDENLLEAMLANLIKNAVEASPAEAEIRVTVSLRDLEAGRVHLIDIHNPGSIPENVRDRFFEPYATSGKPGGTGLGTYSARLAARVHGGEITFTTSRETGTHVMVSLPEMAAGDPA